MCWTSCGCPVLSTHHQRTSGTCAWPVGGSKGGPDLERPMVPPRPVFWALVLVLLGFALGWARQRSCSVPDVLHHYRAVIFEDLHAAMRQVKPEVQRTGLGSRRHHLIRKNLTGDSEGLGRPEVSCGTQEEHSILLSIKSLGRTLRGAVAGDRRGALEKAAWTVAIRTEAVMRRHCWTPPQSWWPRTRPASRRGSRRRLLLRALDTVATCWEKLFALRAAATSKS
ncbi:uncharacterized protein C20orf204 homolog isoform X2 [Cavia porcellus]|uniref:uncharacterized protein C20orf204 homolog isoform X2 n=1 Tax=Cavia porcellus TaxID=10141 RepID=UPI000C87665D|nr:uncharacterized protein LOC111754846 isoform X2 [Cavia porcellus]